MEVPPGTIARPREVLLVSVAGVALAMLMTWPLATGLTHLGRTAAGDADGQFSIWNISWVARTLAADPRHLFDANIFAPHKTTLAYSEANLLPGAIGVPAYWLTRNPWLTLNVVLLVAFASAFAGAYLLFLYVSGSRAGAAAGAIVYAFCPYVMSHLSHIQLLFTGGIPLSLYLFHRLADAFRAAESRLKADTTEAVASAARRNAGNDMASAVRWSRAIKLGVALAAQALSCAYYGIFAGLAIGYATLVVACTRRLWRSAAYWRSIALAAGTAIVLTGPFLLPYLEVQDETGFARSIEESEQWAARPLDYLTSAAHAHAPLLAYSRTLGRYLEVLFPGFLAVGLGTAGLVIAARRQRETALIYASLGILALWSSFGPQAGLYRLFFHLPLFSFLHAPSRLGMIVTMALALFACVALRAVIGATAPRVRPALGALAVAAAVADVAVFPVRWFEAPRVPEGYATLARRARGTVAEFPFYGQRAAFPLHAQYMLFSTAHWLPLVNGYSDVIPRDFRDAAPVLESFPSPEAFAVLARRRVRYIAVHWDLYADRKDEIRRRLDRYLPYLNALASDERMTVYEVTRYP